MAQTQIADVVVPQQFTSYTVQNSVVSTAFSDAGVMVRNGVMEAQLSAGATSFTVPFWQDLPDVEADITTDNPADIAVPLKLSAGKQVTRKSFLHQSWSSMSLASELAGSNPLTALQNRVTAYWDRQTQFRLVATCKGIIAANVAQNNSDMVLDISGQSGDAAKFNVSSFISAAGTLGDALDSLRGIAMHSTVYQKALRDDLIQFIPNSQGLLIKTYRGLACTVDDGLTVSNGVYMTVLFGAGAIGYAVTDPREAPGTETNRIAAAGNGAGQDTLHSRINLALHPLGYKWNEAAVNSASPSISELANGGNWSRVVQRKAVPMAFLITKEA